ncbi:MAG: hypothetical protein LBP73_07195 [Clostridiales Family XIII bacterium]|nr:hypothetical protein [Clostridiales Family XIII bacterium]
MDFDELTKEELLDLLSMYDKYIQSANDGDRYRESWYPVCIAEFYDNEYQSLDDENDADDWEM